jgi:hypothetical protein
VTDLANSGIAPAGTTADIATGTPFIGAPLPAALACTPAGRTAWTAGTAAPFTGTGLPAAGERRRYATGVVTGLGVQLMDHSTNGIAVLGVPATSTTPGDLPPEDPLS